MILANPKTLKWKQATRDDEIPGWDYVTPEWLNETEQDIRESPRWDKSGDKNNELLGRSILWFYQVRDAFDAETQAAETHADEAGEIDSQAYFPLAGPVEEEQSAARRR